MSEEIKIERKDPTSFLPEEPMSYEIKKKKKKKKKKQEDDPFKDIEEKVLITERVLMPDEFGLDTQVTIKAENIEVELDFNDEKQEEKAMIRTILNDELRFLYYFLKFTDNGDLMLHTPSEDSQEPEIKIEPQNHEAVILTFQDVVKQEQDNPEYPDVARDVAPAKGHTCKLCHLIFKNTTTLKIHQRRKHEIGRRNLKHICETCGMAYDLKTSLIMHIKRKHGPNAPVDNSEVACEICSLVFKGSTRLRMHMRRKHNAFADSFQHACEYCGLTYDKLSSLVVHKKRKHSAKEPADEQWYSCPFCPKIFNKTETYGRHMQRKHNVDDKGKPQNSDEFFASFRNEAGEVTCKQCPFVFSSINFLKLHMRRKHNALKEDFRLKCRICNLSYNKIESLKRHVKRKHDEGSYCNVCRKQFATRELYINHSHVKVVKECSLCGAIFANQGGLRRHLRTKHKIDGQKVVFCKICNEGFCDKRQLKPHILRVHYKVTYTCELCNKSFKSRESYRKHVLDIHTTLKTKTEMQECKDCSEKFDDEKELCKHVQMVHTDRDMKPNIIKIEQDEIGPDFVCTKCPITFQSWDELKVHFQKTHHHTETTQCQVCGEIVPETKIKMHIRKVHPKKQVFECKFCDFKAENRLSLTQHLLRHKNANTIKCDFTGCRYKTFYESAMEKHKRRHADLGVKFQCSKCPFQTMNKYLLRYHEEAHETGKKRYACDQCDYATILPANLVQHKYKHSTDKKFKCDFCPFATKYNTSLRFHVKKKHCDLPT